MIARSAWWLWVLAAVIVAAVGMRTWIVSAKPMAGIEVESLVIAGDLLAGERRLPHERMPGYAMMLAGIAAVDPALRQGLACRLERPSECGKDRFQSVFLVQYVAALATLLLCYLIARRLSASAAIAGLTVALTFLVTRPGDLAGFVTPNSVHHLLFIAFVFLLLVAWQGGSLAALLAAGAVLGLTAAIEPHALLLALIVAAALLVLSLRQSGLAGGVVAGGGVVLGAAATAGIVLWLAISLGYDDRAVWRHIGQRLAERVAYNDLGFWRALLAILVPVPLLGDLLQGLFMTAAEVRAHAMYQPGSLVFDAATRVLPEALMQAGGPAPAVQAIWEARVTGEPGAWLGGLPAVLSRGLWGAASLVGLFGLFHLWRCRAYMRVDGRAADFAIVMAAVFGLLIINALLTANFPILNPALPLVYSYAIAYVAGGT